MSDRCNLRRRRSTLGRIWFFLVPNYLFSWPPIVHSHERLWPYSWPPIVLHWMIMTMLQTARFMYSLTYRYSLNPEFPLTDCNHAPGCAIPVLILPIVVRLNLNLRICFEGSTCGRSVLVWEAGNLKRTKNGKRNLPCLFKQSECVKTLFRTVLFKFLTFMTALLLINLFTCTSTTVQLYWPLTASGGCGRLYCL